MVKMLNWETQIILQVWQIKSHCETLNFFKLEQNLRSFIKLLMLVCIVKLNLSKISPVEFVNKRILYVLTDQQIEQG